MVRGNWQKRVEQADARRQASRQKRQERTNRESDKQKMQLLLSLLDEFVSLDTSNVHLWVEAKGGKKDKETEEFDGTSRSPKEKNAHPRSNVNRQDSSNDSSTALNMCRNQFYYGCCNVKGKSGKKACRMDHFDEGSTLASIFLGRRPRGKSVGDLDDAFVASRESRLTTPDAMGMLIHLPITHHTVDSDQISDKSTVSDLISKCLRKEGFSYGGVIYVVVDETLVYDRFRNGLLLTAQDFEFKYKSHSSTDPNVSSPKANKDKIAAAPLLSIEKALPTDIIELVLTYLPQSYCAKLPQVCRTWSIEIGKKSPFLWKHLLQQRNWPLPLEDTASPIDNVVASYRQAYLSHYGVLRDINAVKIGLQSLNKKISHNGEVAVLDPRYSSTKRNSQAHSRCSSFKIWDSTHVIVSCYDCTLHLYQTIPTKSMNKIACSQVISARYSPPKKNNLPWTLVSMDLDEEYIACLYLNGDDDSQLAVIPRDKFLCACGGGDVDLAARDLADIVNTFDLQQLVREEQHLLDSRIVEMSNDIVACGDGCFMLDYAICEEDDVLNVCLCLFSINSGTIIWSGVLNIQYMTRHKRVTRNFNRTSRKESKATVMIIFDYVPIAYYVTVENGKVSSDIKRVDFFNDASPDFLNKATNRMRDMDCLISEKEFVVSTNFKSESYVFFCSRNDESINEEEIETPGIMLQLSGFSQVLHMDAIGEDHIVLICMELEHHRDQPLSQNANDLICCAILIHKPTKIEVGRISLGTYHDLFQSDYFPPTMDLLFASNKETISLGTASKGMCVMSGSVVRSVGERTLDRDSVKNCKSNKKKNKGGGKGGKKDGFARGMSGRG